MKGILIRRVSSDQIVHLKNISRQSFIETFSAYNTAENMRKYLNKCFSIEKLTEELNNKSSEFYFAVLENKVIGYLKLNFAGAQTEINDSKALEIERIYVLKEFHGRNVGQYLYEKAVYQAKTNKLDYLWLGVWEKNLRAINFYKKNGFVQFDKHIFVLGEERQTDILMKLILNGN